jgi:uncharacterized protein (DUF433 family)
MLTVSHFISGGDMHRLAAAKFNANVDPRELPIYTPRDAAVFLGIKPSTLNDWLYGHEYSDNRPTFKPLITPADQANKLLSFFNLVEAHVLAACRFKHRVKVEAIRNALDRLEAKYPSAHPLISQDFFTNGKDLFRKTIAENENLSTPEQLNFKSIMDRFLVHIDRDISGSAFRVWPIIKHQPDDHVISIIHGVASSQPVIDTRAVPVFVVYGRYLAGEKPASIAKDFQVTEKKVRRAIRYVERKEPKAA